MKKPIELETPRLRLRQWRLEDHIPFARLNADPRVMAFFPSTLDVAESAALAQRCSALIAARGWGFWAVEHRANKEFIGFVGLHTPDPTLPFFPGVEVGWRLAFDYWGQGLATEAGGAALVVGFDRLGLDEIVSFTAVGNHRSRAVMTRLGMLKTNETFEHPRLLIGSGLRLHVLYRLPKGLWYEARAERPVAISYLS